MRHKVTAKECLEQVRNQGPNRVRRIADYSRISSIPRNSSSWLLAPSQHSSDSQFCVLYCKESSTRRNVSDPSVSTPMYYITDNWKHNITHTTLVYRRFLLTQMAATAMMTKTQRAATPIEMYIRFFPIAKSEKDFYFNSLFVFD